MGHFAEQTTVVCSGWIEITQRTAIPVPSVFNFALQDLLLFQPQDFQPKTAEKKSCIFFHTRLTIRTWGHQLVRSMMKDQTYNL
jgi:hypothetical protein